jgi:RNA polymerase sigma-70 factor (ECF subfamily)
VYDGAKLARRAEPSSVQPLENANGQTGRLEVASVTDTSDAPNSLAQIQAWVDRYQHGDPAARDALLACAAKRLRRLTHHMLGTYPRVRRWEETDDVFQNAVLRLCRTMKDVPPQTTADFLRQAALNIRRELLDLAKHYYGPQGHGAHHASVGPGASSGPAAPEATAGTSCEPGRLAAWGEFHEQVARLPDAEREVFDLLWYQGLSQDEAARLLGVSERTVKRRWQSARLQLFDALGGELPE